MLRLDKLLSHMGYGTRSEIKKLARGGGIMVNGNLVSDTAIKIDPEIDVVVIGESAVRYREYVYLMLNKPAGVVSATKDETQETVVDLLSAEYLGFNLFPVGRLDKDTEGLLLITNDGQLGHQLTSPKKRIAKKYLARLSKPVLANDIEAFSSGIELDDGLCLPAILKQITNISPELLINALQDEFWAEITLYEGRYHQIKRMFSKLGNEVCFLKRIAIGGLKLDGSLKSGEYRELRSEELGLVTQKAT